jgi:Fic family protein
MNFRIPVSPQTLKTISRIDEFRGQWSAGAPIPTDRLERLAEAAVIQSAAASCRLSGIRVSDLEVAGLLRGDGLPLRDSPAVLGYIRAMHHPVPSPQLLLSADQLQKLHAVLSGNGTETPSRWRSEVYQREAFDSQGHAIGRVFSTLPPRLISQTVNDLLTWTEYELRAGDQHPLVVTSVFILGMIAASPFEHTNGRMARVLIGHALRRAGYLYTPYASVESQMEDLRDHYHDAFDRTQTRFWSGEGNLEPWLEFFLEVLDRHRERVEVKVELEKQTVDYPPLQRSILETVREHGTVNAALLIRATGANRNTLKDNLRKLVDRGVLERTGQKRGTRYCLPSTDRPKDLRGH